MEPVKVGPATPDTLRKYSKNIWGDCPMNAIVNGSVGGWYDEDDFTSFPLPGTQTSEIALGRYKVYNTGAGKVIADVAGPTAFNPGGIISILADTDGDQGVIGTQQTPFSLITDGSVGKLWFECRVATTAILTNANHLFVGLGENSLFTYGAAQPLANANALDTSGALIGFNRLEDGLGVLNASYADRAAAWTNVKASVGAIAALTWVKLGMTFDPNETANYGTFYVNGTPNGTKMSKATMAALTSLDVGALGFCMANFADSSGTANYWYCDWYKIYQRSEIGPG